MNIPRLKSLEYGHVSNNICVGFARAAISDRVRKMQGTLAAKVTCQSRQTAKFHRDITSSMEEVSCERAIWTSSVVQKKSSQSKRILLVSVLPGAGGLALARRYQDTRIFVDLRDADARSAPLPANEKLVALSYGYSHPDIEIARIEDEVEELGNDALFARNGKGRYGGWPVLEARHRDGEQAKVEAALAHAMARVPPRIRDILYVLSNAQGSIEARALSLEDCALLSWLRPAVVEKNGRWRIATMSLKSVLHRVLVSSKRCRDTPQPDIKGPVVPPELIAALRQPADRICLLMSHGAVSEALHALEEAGGIFFAHLHGQQAGERVFEAFAGHSEPVFEGLRFLHAAKRGNIDGAAQSLGQVAGRALLDLSRTPAGFEVQPVVYCFLRLMLAIYSSTQVSEKLIDEASQLLARVDHGQHLLRGAIYNVVLELHISADRYAEAEDSAAWALFHYGKSKAPYMEFFIYLHRAIIQLRLGYPRLAKTHLSAAESKLSRSKTASEQDRLILKFLKACCSYDTGRSDVLSGFARDHMQEFSYGELWPSLGTMAVSAMSEALLREENCDAALELLERWRLQSWRRRRFRLLIEQREISILQGALLWREARVRLENMATRIGRVWMDSARHGLTDLRSQEDILQALLWLRQISFETPRQPDLLARIGALMENRALTKRQRISLTVWQIWAIRRAGDLTRARKLLAELLVQCSSSGFTGPLFEERYFILEMLDDPRMMRGPMERAPIPPRLRRGARTGLGTGVLTRQEWRALLLIAEGCSNKEIARQMDLSLSTTKFHLKNLYRKLDVNSRAAAVEVARQRKLITQ